MSNQSYSVVYVVCISLYLVYPCIFHLNNYMYNSFPRFVVFLDSFSVCVRSMLFTLTTTFYSLLLLLLLLGIGS